MAANSNGRALAASFGKRVANQVWASRTAAFSAPSSAFRHFFSSHYDKNIEEQVRPAVVPDHVINVKPSKYWGPHPKTGVFGPPAESNAAAASSSTTAAAGGDCGGTSTGNGPSVLDQKVWFRFVEDVE